MHIRCKRRGFSLVELMVVVGYFKNGSSGCEDVDDSDDNLDNKLGFRPNDCRHLRYGYTAFLGEVKAFAPDSYG